MFGRDLVPRLADYRDAVNLLLVPAIALVMIVTLVRHAAIAVQHSFYVVWLDEFGITGVEIGILMAAWSVLGSLSALVVGRLVGFVEDQWLIVTAIGAQIVLISLTPLLPNYGFLLIAMALYGGSMGISQPLMISLMARSTGTAHQGKSAGLRNTANQLAAAVIPGVMGGVVMIVGLETSFYVVGGVLLAVLALVARNVASHVRGGTSSVTC